MAGPELRADLRPSQQDEALWHEADAPVGLEPRSEGTDARQEDDRDALGNLLRSGATAWSLDLDDPYAWQPEPGSR